MICNRPNLYAGRGCNTLYFPVGYKSLLYRGELIQNSRSTYTDFAAISNVADLIFFASFASWVHRYGMPKARRKSSRALSKNRCTARFIANALLFCVVGNAFRFGTETSKWNQVRFYFVHFPQVHRFLDKSGKSLIR